MNIDKAQVEKAVSSLKEYISNNDSDDDLLKTVKNFQLLFSLKVIPRKVFNPHFFKVPHPIFTKDISICLITKDLSKEEIDKLKSQNVKGLDLILTFKELRDEYKNFEAKRVLLQSHDLFLADDKVVPLLPKYLGGKFFETKKLPTPIKVNSNLKSQVESAKSKCSLYISTGTLLTVKVGTEELESSQVVENVLAAIDPVVERIPKGSEVIQSIQIKVGNSPALPFYTNVAPISKPVEAKVETSSKKETVQPKSTKSTKTEVAKPSVEKARGPKQTKVIPNTTADKKNVSKGVKAISNASVEETKNTKQAKATPNTSVGKKDVSKEAKSQSKATNNKRSIKNTDRQPSKSQNKKVKSVSN